MRKLVYTSLCLLAVFDLYAQKKNQSLFVGPGFGLDHGGTGVKAEYQPLKYIGFFAGGGGDQVGISGNVGVIYNMLPDKKITPIVTAMAGVNGLIITDYSFTDNRGVWATNVQYGGVTVGAGFDLKFGWQRNQKANFSILVPIHNEDFRKTSRELQLVRNAMKVKPRSVVVAVGWNVDLFNFRPKSKR